MFALCLSLALLIRGSALDLSEQSHAEAILTDSGVMARVSSHRSIMRRDQGELEEKTASVEDQVDQPRKSDSRTSDARSDSFVEGHFVSVERVWAGSDPTVKDEELCETDSYMPSPMEKDWKENVLAWTGDHCAHMSPKDANAWIDQNMNGNHDKRIFSKLCKAGKEPMYIEPLAGVLRDPRLGCKPDGSIDSSYWLNYMFSLDWLVFPDNQAQRDDQKVLAHGGKARFYDAGATSFKDALSFFLETYRSHGIVMDEVHAWEINRQGYETYWKDVDPKLRKFWEPRVTFYDGIGVSKEVGDEHNPVSRIYKECKPEDFCAFKLDIDTPQVELPLVMQLLHTPKETSAKLDEFFFEHHVHGFMQKHGWGNAVDGTFADSYDIFTDLRKLGVRAHSWI